MPLVLFLFFNHCAVKHKCAQKFSGGLWEIIQFHKIGLKIIFEAKLIISK